MTIIKKRVPGTRARVSHEADKAYGYLGDVFVDGDRIYATGGTHHCPTLLVSDDGAQSWRPLSTPAVPGLRTISRHGNALYLCGEYGTLGVSVDSGLTWTTIPVGTDTCLFELGRGADGSWWICGDNGVILRSTDGIAFSRVPVDTDTRLLGIRVVDGIVHVLGYDGTLRRWDGSTFTTITVDEDTPLTDLIVTKAGTWLISADGGNVFRSTDRGETWMAAAVPTGNDLEAMHEVPLGVLIVGNDGTLLFSDDDGETFCQIPTDLTGHLWTIVPFHQTFIVSGDRGAIWTLDVSPTATIAVEIEEKDEAEDEDKDEDEDDDEDEDEAEADEPVRFDSLEQASERWIREGTAFSAALNEYVRKVYSVGPNKAGHEPSETRQNMAGYVREQLVALNAAGEHRKARTLFPPAYEPFDYDGLGRSIHSLAYLRDGRRLACIAGDVFELQADKIVPIPDVMGFSQSPDRRWVAKEYADRIDIHETWDGSRVRSLPCEIPDIASAVISPDGDAILIAAETGIFWLTEHGPQRLLPTEERDRVSYPHAALSPNGRFVAMGTQDTPHLVIDRKTGRHHRFDPLSSYPHYAAFHHDRPEVLLSSCHGLYGSGTLKVELDAMVAGKNTTAEPLDQRAWVYCVATTTTGYLLGERSGYIWAYDFEGEQQWYCFLGSTLTAMAISPDRTRLLVGSFAGLIVELSLTETGSDPRLLTDGPVKDLARWVFWQNHPPLLW